MAMQAVAVRSYRAKNADEMSITEGDELEVVDRDNEDWWIVGDKDGNIGLVPADHIRERSAQTRSTIASPPPPSISSPPSSFSSSSSTVLPSTSLGLSGAAFLPTAASSPSIAIVSSNPNVLLAASSAYASQVPPLGAVAQPYPSPSHLSPRGITASSVVGQRIAQGPTQSQGLPGATSRPPSSYGQYSTSTLLSSSPYTQAPAPSSFAQTPPLYTSAYTQNPPNPPSPYVCPDFPAVRSASSFQSSLPPSSLAQAAAYPSSQSPASAYPRNPLSSLPFPGSLIDTAPPSSSFLSKGPSRPLSVMHPLTPSDWQKEDVRPRQRAGISSMMVTGNSPFPFDPSFAPARANTFGNTDQKTSEDAILAELDAILAEDSQYKARTSASASAHVPAPLHAMSSPPSVFSPPPPNAVVSPPFAAPLPSTGVRHTLEGLEAFLDEHEKSVKETLAAPSHAATSAPTSVSLTGAAADNTPLSPPPASASADPEWVSAAFGGKAKVHRKTAHFALDEPSPPSSSPTSPTPLKTDPLERQNDRVLTESLAALQPLSVPSEVPVWYSKAVSLEGKCVTFSSEEMEEMSVQMAEMQRLRLLLKTLVDSHEGGEGGEAEIYEQKMREIKSEGVEKLVMELVTLKRRERRWALINSKLTLDLDAAHQRAAQLQLEKNSLVEKVAVLHLGDLAEKGGAGRKINKVSEKKRVASAAMALKQKHPEAFTSAQPTEPVLVRKNKMTMGHVEGTKLLVDFELMQKKNSKALKPDPTKPIFSSYTHHLSLPESIRVHPPAASECLVAFCGPLNDFEGEIVDVSGLAAAMCLTTYPQLSHSPHREGTPICDFYHYEGYADNVIVVVADGCNWGMKSWLAARNATAMFVKHIRENAAAATSVQKAGLLLLQALQEAHRHVIAKSHDIWSVGQATILGGILLKTEKMENTGSLNGDRVFVSLSLGDCKSYFYSPLTHEFEDLSLIFRSDSMDAMDPGGRIGPFQHDGSPDLRNLTVSYTVCGPDDMLVVCTDGVHDNFDPQNMGLDPSVCGLTSWGGRDGNCELDAAMSGKAKFTQKWLRQTLAPAGGPPPTPLSIVRALCEHAVNLNEAGRREMESNEKRLGGNLAEFPGKMDHTTCLAFNTKFPDKEKPGLSPPLDVCTTERGSLWRAEMMKQEG